MAKNGLKTKKASYTKGKATRQKIMDAARQVFASHPYTAASIRTIAKQGGFNHPLIHHYFPTKADLFTVVAQDLYAEYTTLSTSWLEGVWDMRMAQSLTTSVDRIVDDAFENPDALRVVMQNMSHGILFADLAGFEVLPEFWQSIQESFRQGLSPNACFRHVSMWILGFHMIVFNCVGAPYYHAKVLGMDPAGPAYREWVKKAILFLLYPSLKQLVFSQPGDDEPQSWPIEAPLPNKEDHNVVPPKEVALKKGELTRLKILKAARSVFAKHPYNTASIRMIGKEGGFDFTLIHHYYPSKAQLFEALAAQVIEEMLPQALLWMSDLRPLGPEKGLSAFADRALDYCHKNPAAVNGLMQNIAQIENLEDMPGFKRFPDFHLTTQKAFRKSTGVYASDEEVRMFACGLYMILYNCLGGATFPAQIIGLDPVSGEYRQWVKDLLMFLLWPVLESMIAGQTETPE